MSSGDSILKSFQSIMVEDLINGLSSWNELSIHQPLAIEEADEHGLYLGLAHGSFFRSWGV